MRSLAVPAILLLCLFLLLLFVVPGVQDAPPDAATPGAVTTVEEDVVESAWLTGLDDAKRKAAETGRPIFALFTGSTWCPPCQYMEGRVFNRKPFADFADAHLVLAKFDVPAGRARTDAEKDALALHDAYNVEAVPTMLLLDAEGRRLTDIPLTALPVSSAEYVDWLKTVLGGLNLPGKENTTDTGSTPETMGYAEAG